MASRTGSTTIAARAVTALVLAALAIANPMIGGVAAAAEVVLSGAQITEEALVEALEPDPPGMTSRRLGPAMVSLAILFETDSTVLTSSARDELGRVGRALNSPVLAAQRFTLQGHADPRGSAEHNLVLSQGRAEAVRRYLVETVGVGPGRLRAEGLGDRYPLNRADPAAPENRRVTIVTTAN